MMFWRIFVFLTFAASVGSVAMAADFGRPGTSGRTIPGAYVTIESGVRVIRPVPFDPAWVVSDETEIPGGTIYHGAAIYRVPSKAAHKAKPEKPDVE